jgi:hypothetical protein
MNVTESKVLIDMWFDEQAKLEVIVSELVKRNQLHDIYSKFREHLADLNKGGKTDFREIKYYMTQVTKDIEENSKDLTSIETKVNQQSLEIYYIEQRIRIIEEKLESEILKELKILKIFENKRT